MKQVVIYYSFTGNNKLLALDLQRRLGCDCVQLSEVRKRSRLTILLDIAFDRAPVIRPSPCDLHEYDCAILVAPVWVGHIASPLVSFIHGQRADLPDFAFISLCSALPGQAEQISNELQELTGRMPLMVAQLNVNELLPAEHKNVAGYVSAYRVQEQDLHVFDADIKHFLCSLDPANNIDMLPAAARTPSLRSRRASP